MQASKPTQHTPAPWEDSGNNCIYGYPGGLCTRLADTSVADGDEAQITRRLADLLEQKGIGTAQEWNTLQDNYIDYCEHPKHPVEDWKYEVANNDTRLGYWARVKEKMSHD